MSKFINLYLGMETTTTMRCLGGLTNAQSHLVGIYVDGDVDQNVLTVPATLTKFRPLSLFTPTLRMAITHDTFYFEEGELAEFDITTPYVNLEKVNLSLLETATSLLFHFEDDLLLDTFQECLLPLTIHGHMLEKVGTVDGQWMLSGLSARQVWDPTAIRYKQCSPEGGFLLGAGYLSRNVSFIDDVFVEDTPTFDLKKCLLTVDDNFIGTSGSHPQVFYPNDGSTIIFGEFKQILLKEVVLTPMLTDGTVFSLVKVDLPTLQDGNNPIVEMYEGDFFSSDGPVFEGVIVTIYSDATMSVDLAGHGPITGEVEIVTNGDKSITRTVSRTMICSQPVEDSSFLEAFSNIGIDKVDCDTVSMVFNDERSPEKLPRLLHFILALRQCLKRPTIVLASMVKAADTHYPTWRENYPVLADEIKQREELYT